MKFQYRAAEIRRQFVRVLRI